MASFSPATRAAWVQVIDHGIAEERRQQEYDAAVKIQSWFRGCRARAYVSWLHRNATVIQKTWRAFSARRYFRQRLKEAYFLMKMNFYDKMAVKIQQRWRGYYVRKYVHNYYARKRYLEALTKKNEQVRQELEELAEYQKRERERIAMEREEQEKYMEAQRLHFLLSTKQRPGVFNSPFRPDPDEMELRLRTVKTLRTRSAPKKTATNQQPSGFSSSVERLPPIHKTPQGPFRPAAEVQQQRQRPLEPSLRVATSITALEEAREELQQREWRTRLIDKPFLPFSKAHQNKEYESLLHTHSPYKQKAYGTKHFREEDQAQLRGKEPKLYQASELCQNRTNSVSRGGRRALALIRRNRQECSN
ncbi:Spermatogenesis-associated protein 17 [Bagarius yarrelli]|uniref:Spermatogenesis-associated protein 17 n=1 Tax=Bagarius yarrelli TaxID=175774 RepID=A0A556UFC1_BAGYA|nr:Spermatogenesis-associated protein 17 [Bagarius yarrelli]